MMVALSAKGAVRMIRGKGENAVTHYSYKNVKRAQEKGVNIIVMRKHKEVLEEPNFKFRDLRATFGGLHELAGQGKYIDQKAFPKGNRKRVVGAQHVNPFLREDGSYHTIIDIFKNDIGLKVLSLLSGRFAYDDDLGEHIHWDGRRDKDGVLVRSAYFTADQLWEICCKQYKSLVQHLRKSKSGRKGAKHKSPKEKFIDSIGVLRRTTCVFNVVDGQMKLCGGVSPYGVYLEECEFAIDKRFLTDGVENGEEVGQFYYGLVIGRSVRHDLPRSNWNEEGVTCHIAYKNDKARQVARKLAG